MIERAEVAALLARLESEGVQLWPDGDQLRFRAPRGALTGEQRALLSESRQQILDLLRERGQAPGSSADAERATDARTDASAVPRAASSATAPPNLDRSGLLPVSNTQQRLWFLKRLDPANAAYNVACPVRFKGELDPARVQAVLRLLAQRHESLRARFVADDGVPHCRLEPAVAVSMPLIDLRKPGATRESIERELKGRVRALVEEPFDLSCAPLWRSELLRLADDEWMLCIVIDHIVFDGQSMGVLLEEFRHLYAILVGGQEATIPPLRRQFVDIIADEQSRQSGPHFEQRLDFWRKELAGLPSALRLPTDRPRPPVQTYHGDREMRVFPAGMSARVRSSARELGATPFMLLLTAFHVLLHRYAGVNDVAVGTAVSNRLHPDSAGVVGFFANNLVLRGDLAGNPTVRELIGRTRETCVRCMEFQDVPFDLVVNALAPPRELDHSPLFQVLFVLQNWARPRLDLPGASGQLQIVDTRTARYDLAVDVYDTDEGFGASFEYNTDLFDAGTVQRMLAQYEHLLGQMLDRIDARIDELELLDDGERRQLLIEWNDTRADYPRQATVHALFEAQVRRNPQASALMFESEEFCYAELNARANRLAHFLHGNGVEPRSLVGVWIDRSVDMVVAILAVLKAGAAYVPLDPAFPQDRIEFMMSDAQLAAVITQKALALALREGAPRAICLDAEAEAIARESDANPDHVAGPEDLAYIIYTSGSTGRPKGVMIAHRSVVNFLTSMHREPGIGEGDRFVAVTTLSFDIAGLELHGPLTAGGTVVLASRSTALDGTALAGLLEQGGAALLQATPATWRLLLESGWRGRPGLKMLCGGEDLPRDLAERLLACGSELWNMYGPTETTIWSTMCSVTDTSRVIPIGRPIANTQVFVLEPAGQPAPIGVAGELCIAGDGLARGYLNREELTAEKFVTIELPLVGPIRAYRTGDLARWLVDGRLEFLGRRDQQVKVRGFRIELGEIEAALASHEAVRQAVVVTGEAGPGDVRLVAYVVFDPGQELTTSDVRRHLRRTLPEYMIPSAVLALESIPLTPNGKVDRKCLPDPFRDSRRVTDAYVEPTPGPEQQLAAIWQEFLGLPRIGAEDNFFEVGGHSLLAVRVTSAAEKRLGWKLDPRTLFFQTLRQLAASAVSAGDSQGKVSGN